MLAGRYPSDEFAELRPRIVWDRTGGVVRGRDGAKRLAVISGGTIPDRGLYGVFMADGGRAGGRAGRGDGVRGPRTARCSSWARARGGSSRSPATACWSRRRRACPASCRSGRATASAGPTSWGGRSGAAARTREFGPLDPLRGRQPHHLPRRPGAGHRRGALRPHDRDRALPRRARRLAGLRALAVRRRGCTPRGRWWSRRACPSSSASRSRRCGQTTASPSGCPTPTPCRPPT